MPIAPLSVEQPTGRRRSWFASWLYGSQLSGTHEVDEEEQNLTSNDARRPESIIRRHWCRYLWCNISSTVLAGCVVGFWIFSFQNSEGLFSQKRSNSIKPNLTFRRSIDDQNSYTFKIVQITDIHLGEAEDLDWGPEQDRKTWKALDAVLRAEAPMDLIVLGGDQLTANNCKDNATAYYKELGEFLTPYGVPWAVIFGNHDDADYETRENELLPPKYLRPDLVAADQAFPLSLTEAGPSYIEGSSNYVLNIDLESSLAAQVFLLDSGGGSIASAITDSQIIWFKEEAAKSVVPAVAFQHIPTLAHTFESDGSCQGFQGEDIQPLDYDGGIMEAISNSNRFFFLAVGHNHGNDYCCNYQDTSLEVCFGRHSGYGGYGKWERGARVYELKISVDPTALVQALNMNWASWVRLESGDIIDRVQR